MAHLKAIRRKVAVAVAGFALRHMGSKRRYRGKVEDCLANDWKTSTRRLGLGRNAAWHDRFRRTWLRLRREP